MMSPDQVAGQLRVLGIQSGSVLVVHTAFSRVKPVDGGPLGLIDALQAALGPQGTLVMPSMSEEDDHVFDPRATPCRHLGVVADSFWRLPGVQRSDSPHAFAARGPAAGHVLQPHPPDRPHGADSPVGRVHELDGLVLLLGVGHDSDTTVHLGEYLAGVRYRQKKHVTVMRDGRPTRLDYEEIDHCCQNFSLVDGWLDQQQRQRRGVVGRAEARLARSHHIVEAVTSHLRANETTFLHPFGVDAECDETRRSLNPRLGGLPGTAQK